MTSPCRRTCCLLSCLAILVLAGCTRKPALFTRLTPAETGITFQNLVTDDPNDQSAISEFSFMGGGVGIGDFNHDGLKDIYLSANQATSRLYLNKGDLHFEDATAAAGTGTQAWATGVSVVDLNGDGYDDIYVCTYGKDLLHRAPNLLFINRRNGTFAEQAAAYGLADTSYSSQAAFFDYDHDGDLDMYLLNYRFNGSNANAIVYKNERGTSPANDRLYRNDGPLPGSDHPHFTDVSFEAGIREDGYGLGIAISDFNHDNWPDVYVSNDFLSNDELWLNNRNGTFTNCIATSVRHQGYSGMGADAADINNDALPDVGTLDMMPEFNNRKKESFSFMNYERYMMERSYGYEPEFARNMLQLNNGNLPGKDSSRPFFSEIGQLAGVSETDWSWSVLMADFNNDGWKDIHITNGIGRDYINSDFIQFSATIDNAGLSETEKRQALHKKFTDIEPVTLGNYLYLNNRNYTFTDVSEAAGTDEPALSNGAAYADLDNDGDLDLVINNINQEAFVLLNHTVEPGKPSGSHSLRIRLQGAGLNTQGIGSKVLVYSSGRVQLQEQGPVRGYLSSVDQTLLFGLGNRSYADSVVVVWPDGRTETRQSVAAGTLLDLSQQQAVRTYTPPPSSSDYLFTDITSATGLQYKHFDVPFNDFAQQRLLPQKYSQTGPAITTGDINGDGRIDLYIGGGFNSTGRFFVQQADGSFQPHELPKDGMREETGCLLFDADQDGDRDLLIGYGDMRFSDTSSYYHPLLFLNDGKGGFTLLPDAIPSSVKTITGCMQAADWDGDGDPDLFIGGRVSQNYPAAPRSYLLRNDGGRFKDVTETLCPALARPGMITAAVWSDINNDRQPELILAGEWMPLRFFRFGQGRFREITATTGITVNSGMWRSLAAADLDGDGDTDLVAGNLGLNCKYHVSPKEPMKLFSADIDGNGSTDPVPFYYIRDGKRSKGLYPAINRDALAEQVPSVKKKFLEHEAYGAATLKDLFPKEGSLELTCEETAHCWFENTGKGSFIRHELPVEAQFAPVNAIVCTDIDGDGRKDILLAGNEYQTEVTTGRYDASYGLLLKGMGKGFKVVPPVTSGLVLNGDARSLAVVPTAQGKLLVAGINNDSVRVFRLHAPDQGIKTLHPGNPVR